MSTGRASSSTITTRNRMAITFRMNRLWGWRVSRSGSAAEPPRSAHSPSRARRRGRRLKDEVVLLGHVGDPAQAGDAADEGSVGLQHVEAAAGDELAEFVELARHLAAGDADIGHLAQRCHAVAVGAVQRLLHPIDAEALELARADDALLERPWRLGVPRHAPALVAVDHQFEPVAYPVAHRFEGRDVGAPIAAVGADLQRREAARPIPLGGTGELVGL